MQSSTTILLLLIVICSCGFTEREDGYYLIKSKLHLFSALSDIDNWDSLCTHLGVSEDQVEEIRIGGKDNKGKKEECLALFYDEEPDWRHVVFVVADYPFRDRKLACKIAKEYMDMDKQECRDFLGDIDKDEL